MPAPLLWLGAALAGAYASDKANTLYMKRKLVIDKLPGESKYEVEPVNGCIVCCGIYGVFDHTGIWVNGNIYELAGSGLVRCLSPNRFLKNRSGTTIYAACDIQNRVLNSKPASIRAQSRLFELLNYSVIDQNCHRFVAEMLSDQTTHITSFSEFNSFLYEYFRETVRWNTLKL